MGQNTVGRPMEILLVEDSLTSARLTMGGLKSGQVQHRLTWVTNGEDALEFLHRRGKFGRAPRPDLILLDLGLPKKDGREVLREIKADPSLAEIPVVVLTASTDHEDRLASERLQVESYLTKPVNVESFRELVAKLSRFWHADMIVPTPG
jgi:two-component system, chemotaxis family, response regulator Rcp1